VLDLSHAVEIAHRYSLGDDVALSGPVARGELGQVWQLSTSLGTWAVKELFERQSDAEARDYADYQDAVGAVGVRVPAVVRADAGAVLLELGHTQVRVYEWVDLKEPDIYLDPAAVGALVASIHRVRFSGDQPLDPWYTDPVGADGWDELFRTLAAAKAPFARELREYRDELVGLEELLEAPSNLKTCHRDLWADNVRSTQTGQLCVIDWENSGLADPSQELCVVLSEFGYDNAERARTLWLAYLDAGGPGRIDRRADFSMVIAQIGHIGELACRGWLEATSEVERDREAGRVAEFIGRGLTLAVIDELLDAVSGAG
jgi:Ser/Thr protein kinase RdoA (MazF antagonist)